MDGTRSACQWGNDPDAVAPGIFGPANLPHLFRNDYVTNSNDSFWLSNPEEPLTGFNQFLGAVGTERTLRTRSGLQMVQQRLDGSDGLGDPRFTLEQLQTLTLSNQNEAGQLLRDGLVQLCESNTMVAGIDVSAACAVLDDWDLKADLDSQGAHLFREFIREGNGGRVLPPTWNYVVPFDVNDPIDTPRGLDPVNNPDSLQSLATAVERLEDAGIALDAPLGDVQSVTRQGTVIPLHGGIEESGVFNKIAAAFDADAVPPGYREVTSSSSSWIQATVFTESGPKIRGILTYSLSTNPDSEHFSDQTELFSNKEWLELPFQEADVAAAAIETLNLREGKDDCKDGGWEAFTQPSFASQGECVEHLDILRQQRLEEIKARQ
jgi:acyl-homoserine-lactone acylase